MLDPRHHWTRGPNGPATYRASIPPVRLQCPGDRSPGAADQKGSNGRPLAGAIFPQLKTDSWPMHARRTIRSKEARRIAPRDKAKGQGARLFTNISRRDRAPSVMVMQDYRRPTDRGFGCFWGEVQTKRALWRWAAVGHHHPTAPVRDMDMMAPGFFVLAGRALCPVACLGCMRSISASRSMSVAWSCSTADLNPCRSAMVPS